MPFRAYLTQAAKYRKVNSTVWFDSHFPWQNRVGWLSPDPGGD